MFLTVHTTAAVVIGQSIANPILAFLVGLISHYILDSIPHGDEKFKNLTIPKKAAMAIVDHWGVLFMLVTLFIFKPNFILTSSIILALTGSMLPDWTMAVFELTKETPVKILQLLHKIITPLEKFHHFCHFNIIKYECSFPVGVAVQILFLLGFWRMI